MRWPLIPLLGTVAAACSFTSLNQYFACPPDQPKCQEPSPSDAGSGGAAGSDAGASAGAGVGGTSGAGGDATAGNGGSIGAAGAPEAGAAGAPLGAGPGEPCVLDRDCARGACFKLVCGDALQVIYADAPDPGTVNSATKWIKFQFQIQNRSSGSYPLSSLTLRYYFTADGATPFFQALSGSAPATSAVSGSFGMTAGAPVWSYLEVSFTDKAGALGPENITGLLKVGMHDADFNPKFFEPDDYSYKLPEHITLYRDNVLVSGVEPD